MYIKKYIYKYQKYIIFVKYECHIGVKSYCKNCIKRQKNDFFPCIICNKVVAILVALHIIQEIVLTYNFKNTI